MRTTAQQWIHAYADGAISSDDLATLEELVRTDPRVREQFLETLNVRAALEEIAFDEAAFASQRPTVSRPVQDRVRQPVRGRAVRIAVQLIGVAAVVIATIVAAYLLGLGQEPNVVTITALNGEARWTGNGGRITHTLATGQRLPGGTLELLSADSWVEFKFQDGSTANLSALSTVTVSGRKQKQLRLQRGHLCATVRPQPEGFPLLVHTQAARLEASETQCNVDAAEEMTTLTVNRGRVRLQRSSGGRVIHVPALHQIVASMDGSLQLEAAPQQEPVFRWTSNLKTDVVFGKWAPNLWHTGKRLKEAVADGTMTKKEAIQAYKAAATLDDDGHGSVWTKPSPYGSLILLSVSRSAERVRLRSDTVFRIEGRLYGPAQVEFGIGTDFPQGGFAGKYRVAMKPEQIHGKAGEFSVDVSLHEVQRIQPQFPDTPVGQELAHWWCIARNEESSVAKLEITNVQLLEHDSSGH